MLGGKVPKIRTNTTGAMVDAELLTCLLRRGSTTRRSKPRASVLVFEQRRESYVSRELAADRRLASRCNRALQNLQSEARQANRFSAAVGSALHLHQRRGLCRSSNARVSGAAALAGLSQTALYALERLTC